MVKRKRTFGELKVGSYIWSAGSGSVSRISVVYLNPDVGGSIDTNKIKVSCGDYIDLSAIIDKDATEHSNAIHHWFTDKQDARECAYNLLQKEIKDVEINLNWLKERADAFKKNFLDC